jgi:integrase
MLMRAVDAYLAVRRAAGYELTVVEYLLRAFARFAAARGEAHVRSTTAIAWAARAPSFSQRARRLQVLIGFARHMSAEDGRHEIPPRRVFAGSPQRRRPYIFTPDAVRRLLEAAGALGPPGSLRPHTYRTLFGLLVTCGLRISEALALQRADVTADGLVIRRTKFRKSRLVPIHETTERAIADYLGRRRRVGATTDRLFVYLRGRPMQYPEVNHVFLALVRALGLRGAPGADGPRLHDLRHTFAVRVLETAPRDAIANHLLALSTYLGHAQLANTYWYLHATPDLMSGIADSCQAYLCGGTP